MAVPSCDWQISCTEVKERGKHLLESGQWSDCKFLVGSEPNQLIIQGHKLFLAMASPVFEAMFYGGMAEKNDPIPILDVQPEAFKALLEYIYTDNININSFDKACELCYGAKKYMLPHLVEECTKYLWSDLSPRNACRAFEFARLFEEPVLMDRSLQIICTNTKEVLAESSFEDIELNTIIAIFSQDYLNVDSELDLFDAAERYAKAKSSEGCVTSANVADNFVIRSPSSGDTKPKPSASSSHVKHPLPDEEMSKSQQKNNQENKEVPSIQSAIKKIRFLSLNAQQFAEGPARSPLLSQAESFAVLMNILSSAPDVPMPEGFSTSTQRRKLIINSANNVTSFTVDTPSPVMPDQIICSNSNGPPNESLSLPPHPSMSQPPHSSMSQPPHSSMSQPPHSSMSQNPHPSPHSSMSQNPHPSLSQPPVALFPSVSTAPLPERDVRDFSKIYCQRTLIQHTDCLNTSVLDCSVTFTVDKNICVIGVQVPTQVLSEESAVAGFVGGGAPSAPGYSELLYAHLLDADGARLTYTHYTSRVPYLSLLDITFNRPVYIQRNKVYKVGIVFNKVGWYPMGTCCQHVAVDSVFFNFGVGQSSDSVRDGLIRSIIFTY